MEKSALAGLLDTRLVEKENSGSHGLPWVQGWQREITVGPKR